MDKEEAKKILNPEAQTEIDEPKLVPMQLTFTVYYKADPADYPEIDVSNGYLLAQAERTAFENGEKSFDAIYDNDSTKNSVLSVMPFNGTWD